MNRFLFIDAISCLDTALIEAHIRERQEVKKRKLIAKRLKALKISIMSACLLIMALSILTFSLLLLPKIGDVAAFDSVKYTALIMCLSVVVPIIMAFVAWEIGSRCIKKRLTDLDFI